MSAAPATTLPVIVCDALVPMICPANVPPATFVMPAWRSKLLPLPEPKLM